MPTDERQYQPPFATPPRRGGVAQERDLPMDWVMGFYRGQELRCENLGDVV